MDHDKKYIYTCELSKAKHGRPITLAKVNLSGNILCRPVHVKNIEPELIKGFVHKGVILGVEVGNDKFPANLFVCDLQQDGIRIVSYEEFRENDVVTIEKPIKKICLNRILDRIKKSLETNPVPEYNLFLNNCQSFVNEMLYGHNIVFDFNPFFIYVVIFFFVTIFMNINKKK